MTPMNPNLGVIVRQLRMTLRKLKIIDTSKLVSWEELEKFDLKFAKKYKVRG